MKRKAKKCRQCKSEYFPTSTTQVVCSTTCAILYNKTKKAKKYKEETTAMKREFNENNRSHQLKLAQKEFNGFIRARDANQPCISCGTFNGKMNAGHYLSVGAHPELRFNESNCHLQCERCNSFLSGNAARYRINLLEKVGTPCLESLEGPQTALNLTLEDIKAIKLKYRQLRKELELQLQEAS